MEPNKSLSARIRRRNKANGGKPLGEGNHKLLLPKEHYGKLPEKRTVATKWNEKKNRHEPRKHKDGSLIYETPRTAHILTMAQKLKLAGKHAGSKVLGLLARMCGRSGNAVGMRTAIRRGAEAIAAGL